VAAAKYWEHMFTAICSRERLCEFTVVDIHDVDFDVNTSKAAARNKFRMVQITLIKSSEYTNPSRREYIVSTHLGEFLNFNDTVMCYDLGDMAHADLEQFDNSHKTKLPDVVIVKKSYPRVRRRQQKRIWKLERMDIEMTDANDEPRRGKKKAEKESKNDAEYNEFLNDIEEDPELRQNINLFKVSLLLIFDNYLL
jgi:nonsense-mediated mRNA decay protein 3